MTANLEELLRQMNEQMKVQFQTLQTAYAEQSAALRKTTDRVQALSEEIITTDIDAMDYAPVRSKERDRRRRRKGLCYKCGSSEHLSPNCKKSGPGQDSRVNRTHDVNTVNQRDARRRSNSRSYRRSPRGRRNSHTSGTSSVDSKESKGRSRN
jgi:hypothetical protein